MPQIFKIGSYWIYFWANENRPLEPIHVHVAEGKPVEESCAASSDHSMIKVDFDM